MKKQFHLFLIFLFGFSINVVAQNTFQKTYNGNWLSWPAVIVKTFDGSYVMIVNISNHTIGLVKIDSSGNIIWQTSLISNTELLGNSAEQTSDSGFIVTGGYGSFASFEQAVLLVKTDLYGNVQWAKSYGGVIGNDEGHSVRQTKDGGFIISGDCETVGPNYGKSYLIKTNGIGDTIWTKALYHIGSSSYCAIETNDGGYMITGSDYANGGDVFLSKIDSSGIVLWYKTYGGIWSEGANSVIQTKDNDFIVCGIFSTSTNINSEDVYLIKTDSAGNLMWSKTYGGTKADIGNSVQEIDDGYIITGDYGFMHSVYLIKTNFGGDTVWTKTYSPINVSAYANSIIEANDKGFVITGSYGGHAFIMKTDSNGVSGCLEDNSVTNVSSPLTQVSNYTPVIYSGGVVHNVTITNSTLISNVTTLCASVGIDDVSSSLNSNFIFPNPSQGDFTITQNREIQNGSISIFNVLGEKVFEEKITNSTENKISLKNISPGIYFVRVSDGDMQTTLKLIVE